VAFLTDFSPVTTPKVKADVEDVKVNLECLLAVPIFQRFGSAYEEYKKKVPMLFPIKLPY